MKEKIKIILSGIGNRSLPKKPDTSNWFGWVELIHRSEHFQLVGAHDVSEEAVKRIIDHGYLKPSQTYQDLDRMLSEVKCDAILISNPAEFHADTIRKALDYNLNLLIEKPFVTDLKEGKKLVNLIDKKGVTAAVIQNWRCKDVGKLLHETIQNDMIGKIGHIFFRYIRDRENPNFPSYIFEEEYPLLYAMGIHHLDLFRYILKDEYDHVSGHSFKPPWSHYKSDTGLNLFLKTKKDVAVIYSGTISARNSIIPQESLIVEGDKGTLFNESQWLEPPLWFYQKGKEKINLTQNIDDVSIAGQYNKSDDYILKNFHEAVSNQKAPVCTARDALHSIATLEASRLACKTGNIILLDDILK